MPQLEPPSAPPPPAADLAAALRYAAERFGHRPAVTVLRAERREEQGFASLAQWAAKGAHLLEVDYSLGRRDRLALAGPPGWLPVAVCLAAWWAGIAVVVDGSARVAVVHEGWDAPHGAEVAWYGDAFDGAPVGDAIGDVYSEFVQAFPDQPPPPHAEPGLLALEAGGISWTQAGLLEAAARWGPDGTLGVEAPVPADVWVPALAVRPLLTGHPTVLLAGADRAAAVPEAVAQWV